MTCFALWGPQGTCPRHLKCLEWAYRYFGDCVCSRRDAVSFALGLASVFFWGVAEVPQIVTNFFAGSTEGVSLVFLMTWTVGDAFNLAGCYLEPATLPTQLYMAVLYTITTVVLVAQSIYYEVFVPHEKLDLEELLSEDATVPLLLQQQQEQEQKEREQKEKEQKEKERASSSLTVVPPRSTPTDIISVPLSRKQSTRDVHYSSARSLTSSYTPTLGSFIPASLHSGHRRGGGHHVGSILSQSPGVGVPHISLRGGNDTRTTGTSPAVRATVLGATFTGLALSLYLTATASSSSNSGGTPSLSSSSLRSSSFMVPILLPSSSSSSGLFPEGLQNDQTLMNSSSLLLTSPSPYILRSHASYSVEEGSSSIVGQVLGWLMAAIYMGGRVPQIILNIQRGTVEGLSPLMFLFALLGNATYVSSILVRSLEWAKIAPNLPWIVDAAVCVLLDLFILGQFVYFSVRAKDEEEAEVTDEFDLLK